ncbi:hypothetical protein V6U90_08905 [Micromonospora sp. CPCC 206060]|uniref:hypothetical protein n=1 Tax=Micromonospora sp. CPCC 206060 TaxID=3122406 RepID=UPI002FEF0F6F
MLPRPVLVVIGVVVVLLGSVACRAESGGPPPPRPVEVPWQSAVLPAPPGPAGRLLVRDVVACAGRWYVVGGSDAGADQTRPAAWTSPDGVTWTSVPVAPVTYYGEQNVLYAAGCRDDRLAVLGAKNGGAHGNPRTSNWHLAGGRLVEMAAPFELYGGPNAVNVARVAGGTAGWLIVGARRDGAAAWVSTDGVRFELIEGAPELAGDARGRTTAYDVVATPAGWLAVGGLLVPGRTTLSPLVWTSADGRAWQRVPVAGADEPGQPRRVTMVGTTPVAVGPAGTGFAAWRPDGAGWRVAARFGSASGTVVPTVSGLAAGDGRLVAVTVDGAGHSFWVSGDTGGSWRPMTGPGASVPAGGDKAVAVAVSAGRLVVVVDDGGRSGVWWAVLPAESG